MANEEKPQKPVTPIKQKAAPDPTPRKDKSPIEVYIEQTKTRGRIREQMREEMLECPIDAFLAHYSPFLPDDALVDTAIQALASKSLLVMDERGEPERWEDFDEELGNSTLETKAFGPLQDIANVFDDALDPNPNGRKRKFFYRNCPYDEVKSEIPGCNFKMDACFNGNPGHALYKHVICSETAVVAEFKKSTKDVEDNREQLISAASHIMNDDPCRMWMYGITIENTEMAVWYFSRSHSVKSKTFDFTKDIKTFIRVILSFVYAKREEMGYDPTVHRIEGLRYVYEIPTENGTRYFKTIDLIAHQRVLCITGRKTRVWRAVEVKGFEGDAINEKPNGNKEVALKDVWLDDGSKTEKQKLDAVFERLKTIKEDAYGWAPSALRTKLKDALETGGYKDYFMEIVCDSFNLGRSKNTSDQATPAPGILNFTLSRKGAVDEGGGKAKAVEDRNMLTGSMQSTGYNHTTPSNSKEVSYLKAPMEVKPRSYIVKRQYRLVYKEIGESLDRVETLEAAFSALLDAYIALVLMYLAGWMHRDVSAGNIIAVKKPDGNWGGKLSDLEYAKHCEDDSGSSDPKTGTAFFMPVEIHLGKAYRSVRPTSQSGWSVEGNPNAIINVDVDPFSSQPPSNKNFFSKAKPKPPHQSQPKYRFQHCLESLWWVASYVLTYRVDHPAGKALSDKLFNRTALPGLARRQFFEDENVAWSKLNEFLHPDLRHESIMISMNAIPFILFRSYFLEEPVTPKVLGEVYCMVFQYLAVVVSTIKTEIKNVPFHSTHHVQANKRAHPETSSKHRDDDEFQGEEEQEDPSSDDAVRRPKKRASTSTGIRRR